LLVSLTRIFPWGHIGRCTSARLRPWSPIRWTNPTGRHHFCTRMIAPREWNLSARKNVGHYFSVPGDFPESDPKTIHHPFWCLFAPTKARPATASSSSERHVYFGVLILSYSPWQENKLIRAFRLSPGADSSFYSSSCSSACFVSSAMSIFHQSIVRSPGVACFALSKLAEQPSTLAVAYKDGPNKHKVGLYNGMEKREKNYRSHV